MRSFKHSGDAGDIIYSMPTVKLAGGGDFYLSRADCTRVKMNEGALNNIAPLLRAQSYIRNVALYRGQSVAFDLDAFRPLISATGNLAELHLRAFGFPKEVVNEPWLTVERKKVAKVVINRSTRYLNDCFPWEKVVDCYRKDAVFVGTRPEWQTFCRMFGEIPYHATKNLLELAQIIAGSKLFIGNQSSPCAIAEGLKHPLIQEVWLGGPNCMFNRPDAQNVSGERVVLPKV